MAGKTYFAELGISFMSPITLEGDLSIFTEENGFDDIDRGYIALLRTGETWKDTTNDRRVTLLPSGEMPAILKMAMAYPREEPSTLSLQDEIKYLILLTERLNFTKAMGVLKLLLAKIAKGE